MDQGAWPSVKNGFFMNSTFLLASLYLLAWQDGVSVPAPADLPAPVALGAPICVTEPFTCYSANQTCCDPIFWLGTEYLLWWTKNAPLPVPLVTQGSPNDQVPGALGQPGTTVLYGGQSVSFSPASGLRISAGLMVLPEVGLSLEGSWMMLESQRTTFAVNSNGNGSPIYAQPITSAATGLPAAEPVSIPNPFGVAGGIAVTSTSRLEGWDTNLGYTAWNTGTSRFVLLAGVRSLDLLESLTIDTNFRDVSGIPGGAGLFFLGAPSTNPATQFYTEDRFRASNIFYGGQLGGRFTQEWGAFSLSLLGKVALGATQELVTVTGYSSAVTPGQPTVTAPGGVLALPSNIGQHYQSQFAVVPEGTLTFGWQLTSWAKATIGYNILYCSAVARPGDQIDLTVNRSAIPTSGLYGMGPASNQPAFTFHSTDYWAQGINIGLLFSF